MTLEERVATLSGLGRIPLAPGTAASLLAALLAWPIEQWGGRFTLLSVGVVAAVIGIWACERYARDKEKSDPSECVVDELAGQWIACAFAPRSVAGFAAAFVLFRVFDITKPWPISRLERIRGGAGIMADDLGAALASGAVVAVLARVGLV